MRYAIGTCDALSFLTGLASALLWFWAADVTQLLKQWQPVELIADKGYEALLDALWQVVTMPISGALNRLAAISTGLAVGFGALANLLSFLS